MHKSIRKTLPILLSLSLVLGVVASADNAGQRDLEMSDPGGHLIIAEPDLSAVGEFSSVADHLDLQTRMRPPRSSRGGTMKTSTTRRRRYSILG